MSFSDTDIHIAVLLEPASLSTALTVSCAETLGPLDSSLPLPSLPPLEATNMLSVFMKLMVLDTS